MRFALLWLNPPVKSIGSHQHPSIPWESQDPHGPFRTEEEARYHADIANIPCDPPVPYRIVPIDEGRD